MQCCFHRFPVSFNQIAIVPLQTLTAHANPPHYRKIRLLLSRVTSCFPARSLHSERGTDKTKQETNY